MKKPYGSKIRIILFIHGPTFQPLKMRALLVLTDGSGITLTDSEGKQYMDGIGGLWCVNIGYGREEMADAIAEQARRIPYFSTFGHHTTPPAAALAAKLS